MRPSTRGSADAIDTSASCRMSETAMNAPNTNTTRTEATASMTP
ncbi:MAG: hypothetical protein V8S24_15415 [Gordonibacter pamelaeae]